MARSDEDKQLALNARASKLWRTLRIASKSQLNLFDKIDDGNNLQVLFQPDELGDGGPKDDSGLSLEGPGGGKDPTPTPVMAETEGLGGGEEK